MRGERIGLHDTGHAQFRRPSASRGILIVVRGGKLAVVAQLGSVNDSLLEMHEKGCVEYEIENDWSVRSHALVERGGSGAA